MISFIKNYILIELMIRRLKKDAVKHHPIISPYSQTVINCAILHRNKFIVNNGFWCIGNIEKEFCKIKNTEYKTEPMHTWIKLSSWNKTLVFTKLKEEYEEQHTSP